MKETLTFKLFQEARKRGGDRYACEADDKFHIYIPQYLSRVDNKPAQIVRVTFNTGD